jgi:hypothetical protein
VIAVHLTVVINPVYKEHKLGLRKRHKNVVNAQNKRATLFSKSRKYNAILVIIWLGINFLLNAILPKQQSDVILLVSFILFFLAGIGIQQKFKNSNEEGKKLQGKKEINRRLAQIKRASEQE